ncbi:hypothetical protein [Sphingomonas sp.]|uniref:hypothetical protein n=1 Tax=Sphingomonas sp. TaxID=28214 RepID=UPI0031DC9781
MIVFALPVATPFRRHQDWRTVFVLFGVVKLSDDHRRHLLVCRRAQRRYSIRQRQWVWTSRPLRHAPPPPGPRR